MPAQDLDSAVKKLIALGASDEDIIFFMQNYKSEPEIIGDRSEVPLPTFEPTASIVPEKTKPAPKKPLSTIPFVRTVEKVAENRGRAISPLDMFQSFLPENMKFGKELYTPEELPSYPTRALQEIGNDVIRGFASPGGIITGFMGGGGSLFPQVRGAIGNIAGRMFRKPSIPPITNPARLLPETAGPNAPLNPRFIVGMEGIAENKPYNYDPTTVPDYMSGSGTILERELGERATIPPELAAQGMTGAGRPAIIKSDAEKAFEALIPERYKTTPEPEPYLGQGTARPGEPQLPSAPPKPSRFITPEAQTVADTPPPPLVSPVTGQPVSNIISAVRSGNPKAKRTKNVKVGEQPRQGTVARVIDALFEARNIRSQQENLYSMERAKRFGMAQAVKVGGLAGHRKQLSKLGGELPKVEFESLKLNSSEIDTMLDIVNQTPTLTFTEKLHAKEGLIKLFGVDAGGGIVPQNNEINMLMEVFNQFGPETSQAFLSAVKSKMSRGQKFNRNWDEANNFRKAIMASLDTSAPFSMALPYYYKGEWWRAWGNMYRAWGRWGTREGKIINTGKEFSETYKNVIRADKDYDLANRSGLKILENPEFYQSRAAEKIPGIGASSRAHSTYLWDVRFNTFKNILDRMEQGTHSSILARLIPKFPGRNQLTGKWELQKTDWTKSFPKIRENELFAKALAEYINTTTGAGSLNSWAGSAEKLNKAFFAPGRMASRFQMFGPGSLNYYKVNPIRLTPADFTPEMDILRKEKFKAILSMGGVAMTLAALAKGSGINISLAPTNSDFLKVRVGNTRFDFMSSFSQYATLYARLATLTRTSSFNQRKLEYGSRYGLPNLEQAVTDFLFNKASPEFGWLWLSLRQKDYQGGPIDWNDEQLNRSIPFTAQTIWEVAQENPELLPFALPASFIGINVQAYGREKPGKIRPK